MIYDFYKPNGLYADLSDLFVAFIHHKVEYQRKYSAR